MDVGLDTLRVAVRAQLLPAFTHHQEEGVALRAHDLELLRTQPAHVASGGIGGHRKRLGRVGAVGIPVRHPQVILEEAHTEESDTTIRLCELGICKISFNTSVERYFSQD